MKKVIAILTAVMTMASMASVSSYAKNTKGDVNGDGIVDCIDASQLLIYYSEALVNEDAGLNKMTDWDVNEDGIVDASDASCILRIYAESLLRG